MSLEKEFQELEKLRDGADVDIFDEILNTVAYEGGLEHIGKLCSLFENDVEQPCQCATLIDCIFYIIDKYDIKDGFEEVINNFDKITDRGSKWVYYLNKSCIETKKYKSIYLDIVKKSREDIKLLIKENTERILKHSPARSEEINEILDYIS